jgi:uncharacterized protein (TIGR00255 family)
MLKSMTAYGRATKQTPLGSLICEVHSVNRKNLDINVYLGKELFTFDIPLRKAISENVYRGQVTLRATLQLATETLDQHSLRSLKELKERWEKIASGLGFSVSEEISLPFLLAQLQTTPSLDPEFEKQIEPALFQTMAEALKEFNAMKEVEGRALEKDILSHLNEISEHLETISRNSSNCVEKYRKKLEERLQEFSEDPTLDERLLREVVIFAEKCDISEEIARLNSHIEQFTKTIATAEQSCGKQLDFLAQEMHREINTISSKVSDIEMTKLALEIKSELEKIREQIQNVE